jgi:uncharacterized protein (TIGR02679 family)
MRETCRVTSSPQEARPQEDRPRQEREAQPFAHLSAPNAVLYREVLRTFARAKERFIVHLRPEDVAAELRRDSDDEAVVLLHGPVDNRDARQAALDAAWRAAFLALDTHLGGRPELAGWRAWLSATGLVRRLAPAAGDARALLDRLAVVLARLPAPGLPIGRLAAETCGDAHALDDGTPLATLALSAARALAGLAYADEGGADARRAAWAAAGVHLDDLSSMVLCLGLPGDDHTPTGRMLAAAQAAGEPCVLTLRQLRRHTGPLDAGDGSLVRVCENPVVVSAAADERGPSCAPLVCVGGRPSAAAWRLLELLAAGGATFAYHGDFDWGGIAIAAGVRERAAWRPWRYDAAAYEKSYDRVSSAAPLTGRPRPTPWDPRLAESMVRRAVRVEEELVLADLLTDLARK